LSFSDEETLVVKTSARPGAVLRALLSEALGLRAGLAVAFLTGAAFLAVAFLAGAAFLAVAFLAGAAFLAVAFLAGAAFLALAFLAGAAFLAFAFLAGAAFLAVAFLAGADFLVAFFAVFLTIGASWGIGSETIIPQISPQKQVGLENLRSSLLSLNIFSVTYSSACSLIYAPPRLEFLGIWPAINLIYHVY